MVKFKKQHYERWTKFRMGDKHSISESELKLVSKLHSEYYKHKYIVPCSCSPKRINSWIADLNKIWENGSE